ncbi:MAG: glycosyltransferase family 2 protein [Pseudomonadota bacterium]
MKPGISVVIPNFNGKALLESNLPSVFSALQASDLDYEVIVCDDCSSDNSVEFLKQTYPQVNLVLNSHNSGFSTNINSGFRKAKLEWVLALNNDVSLAPDYFSSLLSHFESKDTFGVMGALLDPKSQAVTDGAKLAEQSFFGVIRSTRNIVRENGAPLSTFFLSGANALMDRKKLLTLGFFDEVFDPYYNEDVELSLRAWRMGWKCVFEPRAVAYHASSSTIQKIAKRNKIRIVSLRNRFVLHDIHLGAPKRLLFFGKLALDLLTRWLSCDWGFYKAFLEYRHRKPAIESSKVRLKDLKPVFSLAEVIASVRKDQLKTPHRVFS